MRWELMALLLGGAVVASGPPTFRDLERREGVRVERMVVENGGLRARKEDRNGVLRIPGDVSYWDFRKTPRGTLIYASSGGWKGWYLNYDHKGKDRRVGLVPEPGPGCYWRWTEGRWKEEEPRGEGPVYTIPCRAKAANGPLKGWSLTAGGADVVLAKSPPTEFCFRADVGEQDTSK